VIGLGGLRLVVVQVVRALCVTEIIAVEKSQESLKLAGETAADALVRSDENGSSALVQGPAMLA
jgi:D-arabinose 1-dehydrogenase-like Zn-dependent alcohol dehydrogenase